MGWGFPAGPSGREPICECRRLSETLIGSLGWEDPLEKGMAIHSSITAWRIPWKEEPGRYIPWGHKELDTTEQLAHTKQMTSILRVAKFSE